jgi:hypothetical protein
MSRFPSIGDSVLHVMVASFRIGQSPASNNRLKMSRISQRPIRKRSTSAVQYTIERDATTALLGKEGEG